MMSYGGSTVFNGITLFKHKGDVLSAPKQHDGHQGKPAEIKALFFPLCRFDELSARLCVLRVEALSR